ncbi:phBC6A51 family helix-turn-helix protein [Ligilactobacillus salivarius]|uniref:phBC6A51 family helix-turn-helix protein n=1 Tax=Ligilactobacillus salivarius TaxID=1624 RepID=UPI0030DC554B
MKKSSKKLDKIGQLGPFFELDKRRQKAVILLFEDELIDEEIAKNVQRRRSTLDNWKNDDKFKAAQEQYKKLVVKKDFESKALRELVNLLNAKSEMVRLKTAITILKMSGMMSDNSTPELDKAKVRKANAEADIAEYKAKALSEAGASGVELVNKYLDKLDATVNEEVGGNNES